MFTGLAEAGHTIASFAVEDPHGHGLPVHDHVTNCELPEAGGGVTGGGVTGGGVTGGGVTGGGVTGVPPGLAVYVNEVSLCTLTTSPAAMPLTTKGFPGVIVASTRCEPPEGVPA
jgi:hypothetical protein